MDIYNITIKLNENLYLKDPESSSVGKQIVAQAIELIYENGFEQFTFKKLAQRMESTEATIYRYFENKHRLLIYLLNWYWSYLDLYISYETHNILSPERQLEIILKTLVYQIPKQDIEMPYNREFLHKIVITDGLKAYFHQNVDEINNLALFLPYKKLCGLIAGVITRINPQYEFPHSLASTMVETLHQQQYFAMHLPSLTNSNKLNYTPEDYTYSFVYDMLKKILG